MSRITGLTSATPKKLLLDAGAFYKNYDVSLAYTAQTTGELIGATQGGGSFSAVPTIRKMEVDGAKGNTKGLQAIDEWVVTMVANVKEITAANLALALGAATSAVVSDAESAVDGYTKVTPDEEIADADYTTNITWVGRLLGSGDPVIIVIKNALSLNGLSMTVADKNESNIPLTVTGHYDVSDLETPPFEIYYPVVA